MHHQPHKPALELPTPGEIRRVMNTRDRFLNYAPPPQVPADIASSLTREMDELLVHPHDTQTGHQSHQGNYSGDNNYYGIQDGIQSDGLKRSRTISPKEELFEQRQQGFSHQQESAEVSEQGSNPNLLIDEPKIRQGLPPNPPREFRLDASLPPKKSYTKAEITALHNKDTEVTKAIIERQINPEVATDKISDSLPPVGNLALSSLVQQNTDNHNVEQKPNSNRYGLPVHESRNAHNPKVRRIYHDNLHKGPSDTGQPGLNLHSGTPAYPLRNDDDSLPIWSIKP